MVAGGMDAREAARLAPYRAFPGDPLGTPTWAISHYIETVLYPLAHFHHDLHSGGSSLAISVGTSETGIMVESGQWNRDRMGFTPWGRRGAVRGHAP